MAFTKLWIIAWRDLGRNKRRSFFSILAVGLGLALLIVMNGFVSGMFADTLENTIRLETGHLQLRTPSYEEEKTSLLWKDLLQSPEVLAQQANALEQVEAAAPVLWASAYLNTRDESVGLRIYGIETESEIYSPFRDAMVSGEFLTEDDRGGILIGKRLADSLELGVGDAVSVAIIDADGRPDESVFTIRGIYSTGVFIYDDSAMLMPLSKAQAFANTGGRASAVTMWLNDQEEAETVAAALQNPEVKTLTWRSLNEVLLATFETGVSFYLYLYGIVILIVAMLIANTLLMAVFERIREIGILAALGMKGRQITLLFLIEALILGMFGVILGNIIGSMGVAALAANGIPTGDMGAAATNMALGATMNAKFNPGGMISLSIWTIIITLVASLYPAWYASRQEPVEALHSL
ncbi:MAG: ABC transporter permease [Chloroflexi bacterium]|nr:ABC transporter permease [Chloroflexota bacterium]